MHATCATINVTSLAFGLPYVQQLVIPTRLTFLGHLHEFVPLAPLRMPGTAELPTPTLDKCERWAANENTRWRKTTTLARTGQRMRLVVLGTSVTAGCGSAEDVVQGKMYGAGRQHNRSVGLSQFCEPMRSWGRHLRDFLVRQLGSDWAPEVEISPKNAVAADWFARTSYYWRCCPMCGVATWFCWSEPSGEQRLMQRLLSSCGRMSTAYQTQTCTPIAPT